MAAHKNPIAKKIATKREKTIPPAHRDTADVGLFNAANAQIPIGFKDDPNVRKEIIDARLECLKLAIITEHSSTTDAVTRRANAYQRFVFGTPPETAADARALRKEK